MDVTSRQDPIAHFQRWLEEARDSEPNDPDAASLATATPDGVPSSRMVLLKGADEHGFVFYTNLESRKGRELLANPHAALTFHWKSLRRQVRVEGPTDVVDDQEADAYFASRPRMAQIGAWASKQSWPMKGRFDLERRVARTVARFPVGTVPRPEFWSGFRIIPERIEFWTSHEFRLHDRLVYHRDGDGWTTEKLYP